MQLDHWRVSDGYFNTGGQWVATDEDVRRALHASLGGNINRSGDDQSDIAADGSARSTGGGPELLPTWFVKHGDAPSIDGSALLTLEDGSEVIASDRLPPDLPLGSHRLVPDDGGRVTNLFVVPTRQAQPSRGWGWASQLYATRSAGSWGHGDLADLGRLANWASSMGAGLVAHNPLGSSLPLPSQEPSPYFGSSRRFLSLLYLNVERVVGADRIAPELDGLARAGRGLNDDRMIDRDRVFALKMAAVERIWGEIRSDQRVVSIVGNSDRSLIRHSVFCALAETYGVGWPAWPSSLRHPDSPAVEEFRRANADRVDFWCWVHLELERELAEASKAGAGLMADLAVGFDPDGSDAWADQDFLALDCRVGAPGDDFNPDGQDWGVTPYVPWKLRNAGYEPWLRTLRPILRNCAGLRIDHVMGLFRLFWIPASIDPADDRDSGARQVRVDGSGSVRAIGAYVYQYGTELLDLALMEAAKAGVWLAGEDLGTVEDDVRSAMNSRGVLGYRVGWFEDVDPSNWPVDTVGSLNTHDLATVAGVCQLAAGLTEDGPEPDDADEDQAVDDRPVDDNDRLLVERLARLAGIGSSNASDQTAASVDAVILAAHESLAGAGSAVVLSSLDDSQALIEQPNHPGTVDEFPNWRLALPVPIEDFDTTLAPQIAEAMISRHNSHRRAGGSDASDSLGPQSL
ncbi:MAG: 4-alpha-glucanotransferase [Microthrixaceae bacterium]